MMVSPELGLLALFLVLQVGDAASTIIALRSPALAEGNRAAAKAMSRWGVVVTAIVFKLLAAAIAIVLILSDARSVVKIASLAGGCALYAWVVFDNARLCWKHRAGRAS